jgi:hypothetical protein
MEDGPTMTIQRKTGTRSSTVTYRLDGKDVTNENPALRITNTYRSRWEGSALVTEIWAGTPTGAAVAVERRSVVQPGEMFVETKRQESTGETTTKMFFKKQGSGDSYCASCPTSRFGAVGDLHAAHGETGDTQDERGQEQ